MFETLFRLRRRLRFILPVVPILLIVLFVGARVRGGPSPVKMKVRGYITARPDEHTAAILDDQIHFSAATRLSQHTLGGETTASAGALGVGSLIEAEGTWVGKHQFSAERITIEVDEIQKQIHNTAYLQEEPSDTTRIAGGEPAVLKADGERLVLREETKREWNREKAAALVPVSGDSGSSPFAGSSSLAGFQVRYSGNRGQDGLIAAEKVELGPPAPRDAYKMPHGLEVVRAKDPQTGIDILEFRRGKKVDGRLKLFPVREVQEYVTQLGVSLLPQGSQGTTKSLDFRFFVIEDPSINALALPDGTVFLNTGLLGAVDNEAELAFVLSHEIAHVLQVHSWREVHETRPARIGLLVAGIAAGAFIGDVGLFLAEVGMISVVNGHQRALENQADRLGLQNVIEHGYDARQAPNFMRIIVERYANRSTSKIWSNHDSSLLRGSFLTVQLLREYPQAQFAGKTVDTKAFREMREAMGPVKIE
ncbi:MAG TPA: M48 family metalloprotease [Candidatus Acidoferrales bacterium]|nr:M48 family metalloprotease [Candidatus Acidoferrales bacterium]